MLKPEPKSKSPLTLSLLVACLVIATLVMISNYFFRPGLELDLRNKIVTKLYSHDVINPVIEVEGRNVILKGIARNKGEATKIATEIQNISGVHHLENQLLLRIHSE